MKDARQILQIVVDRIGQISRRPLMYGGSADGVDLLLHHDHRLWAEILGRSDDLDAALARVHADEGCDSADFPTHYRHARPRAADAEVAAYVVRQWKAIGALSGLDVRDGPTDEDSQAPQPPHRGDLMMDWSNLFAEALPYAAFLDRHASPAHRSRWDAMHARFALTAEQTAVLGGFARRMPVLCLAGAWCGDCVNQCPAFDHFARASAAIELRFLDRDARADLRDALAINGGHRVPVVVFLSEDWYEVARYGERTLSTYRRLAAEQLGPSCPTGLVAPSGDALAATAAEWLAEFERAQLVLRLSPRLRQMHDD